MSSLLDPFILNVKAFRNFKHTMFVDGIALWLGNPLRMIKKPFWTGVLVVFLG